MDDADLRLDANVAAGLLAEVFRAEMTTSEVTCGGCGAAGPVGTLAAYGLTMGVILRCPSCDTAVIRASRVGRGQWLDLRGVRMLRIPVAQ